MERAGRGAAPGLTAGDASGRCRGGAETQPGLPAPPVLCAALSFGCAAVLVGLRFVGDTLLCLHTMMTNTHTQHPHARETVSRLDHLHYVPCGLRGMSSALKRALIARASCDHADLVLTVAGHVLTCLAWAISAPLHASHVMIVLCTYLVFTCAGGNHRLASCAEHDIIFKSWLIIARTLCLQPVAVGVVGVVWLQAQVWSHSAPHAVRCYVSPCLRPPHTHPYWGAAHPRP